MKTLNGPNKGDEIQCMLGEWIYILWLKMNPPIIILSISRKQCVRNILFRYFYFNNFILVMIGAARAINGANRNVDFPLWRSSVLSSIMLLIDIFLVLLVGQTIAILVRRCQCGIQNKASYSETAMLGALCIYTHLQILNPCNLNVISIISRLYCSTPKGN